MKDKTTLNQNNLKRIGDYISVPQYGRETINSGIVHIGVGGFHRAHQAYYTHQLQEQFPAKDWGICGMGLRKGDQKINDVLQEQDGLYTLIIKHPNGKVEPHIIGAILDLIWRSIIR